MSFAIVSVRDSAIAVDVVRHTADPEAFASGAASYHGEVSVQ
jgi:hypothetical protein